MNQILIIWQVCWASYSENVIQLLITPFKSNHVTVLFTLFQK